NHVSIRTKEAVMLPPHNAPRLIQLWHHFQRRALLTLKLLLVCLFIASCGGGGASSDSSSNSAPSSSSGGAKADGDLAAGKVAYEGACLGCHGATGNGSFPIDINGDTLASLTEYIRDNMPPLESSRCSATCAADTAAYIFSWNSN